MNNSPYLKKEGFCGARVDTITVSSELANDISSKSPNKKLRLSLKGLQDNTHSEVPLVKVVNGRGQTIFNREPGVGRGRGYFDKQQDIFEPFDPCEEIV